VVAGSGPPAWLTAVAGGIVAATLTAALGPSPVLPLFVALAVLGVLLGAIDLACLHVLPGRAVGRGDVTLARLLGAYLGWLGWTEVVLGAALPWLVNAPVLLALLATGRIGRRSAIPFGPAMLVGAWLTVPFTRWTDTA
jgi:leader peptidase (prepilin peptidase)/N-methyltransferase